MKDITDRIEKLGYWHQELQKRGKPEPFSSYFGTDGSQRRVAKQRFDIKGCYLVYKKGDDELPIYVGTTKAENRTIWHRLCDLREARNHILAHNYIKKNFLPPEKMSIARKELEMLFKENPCLISQFQKVALEKFSLKVIPDRDGDWKIMEIGLIFLYKPKYNSETMYRSDVANSNHPVMGVP